MRINVNARTHAASAPPPPTGTAIVAYFPPTFAESAFSDTPEPPTPIGNSLYATGVTSSHDTQITTNPTDAGFYLRDGNAPVKWSQVNKPDYYDAAGTLYGTAPYARTQIVASPTEFAVDFDVLALIKDLCGKYPNYGLCVVAENTGAIRWRSRFAATNFPTLIVDGVVIPCAPNGNAWFTTSGQTTQAGNAEFRTAAKTDFGLLRFDLRGLDPTKIGKATLRLWTFYQERSQAVGIHRLWNPADPASIAPVTLGLAARYPKDVGIENDPSVLFVQQAKDAKYQDLWLHGSNGDGSSLITPAQLIALGLPPPPGGMNAIACNAKAGGDQSQLEAHWSPWRGAKGQQQLKPPKSVLHLHLRFYLMIVGDPNPAGGKLPGYGLRYCDLRTPDVVTVPGMGRGNSGSGVDLLTGNSARMNFTREPTPGSPTVGRIGVGHGDCYIGGQSGPFGVDMPWSNHYIGQLKKGVWHCLEEEIVVNSVTQPTEKQMRIASITSANGVATVTLMSPATSALYRTGARCAIGGAALYGYAPYNRVAQITVIDALHFTYPVPTGLPSPCNPGWGPNFPVWLTCCLSEAIPDGALRGWGGGRLASNHPGLSWRHSAFVTDGSTGYGIDDVWFCIFQGGGSRPTTDYAMYLAGIVVAENYIGPMVQ